METSDEISHSYEREISIIGTFFQSPFLRRLEISSSDAREIPTGGECRPGGLAKSTESNGKNPMNRK